jgi:O-antigen/teichoic acid export membrane protein
VNFVALLNYRIDVYVVATFASAGALGIYTVAVSGAESLGVLTQVASIVTAPHIGSLGREEAAELTARAMRSNFALALLAAGVLYFVATPLITVLYGHAFAPAAVAFRILLIGVIALSNGGIVSSFFTLQLGNPNVPLRIASLGAGVCLIISLILVPRIGIVGAAIATSVAYVLSQVVVLLVFYRSSGIPLRKMLFPNPSDIVSYRKLAALIVGRVKNLAV